MRVLIRALDGILLSVARRNLRYALFVAGRIGKLANAIGLHGLDPHSIEDLVGYSTLRDAKRIARAMSRSALAMRCIDLVVRERGLEALEPVTSSDGLAELHAVLSEGRGVVLATFHVGTLHGLSSWLRMSGKVARAFRSIEGVSWERPEVIGTTTDESRRLAGLKEGIAHLRDGGMVCIAVDAGAGDSRVQVTLLGRSTQFRRGAAALSRITRAPIHPVYSWWDASAGVIRTEFGARIDSSELSGVDPDDHDAEILRRLASWIDQRLETAPELLAFHAESFIERARNDPSEMSSRSSP